MTNDIHAPLRDDVRLLGDLLGRTLREQVSERLFDKVESIRTLAKQARGGGDWQPLRDLMNELSDDELLAVARAFCHFLNYANIAEQHHRVRRRRAHQTIADNEPQRASLAEVIPRLLRDDVPAQKIYETASNMQVELVLTAHPTEITRRTLRRKYDDISAILADLDRTDLTIAERRSQTNRLHRRIVASWHSDEIRRHRPTPVDEAKWGFGTVESTLWYALPEILRRLDRELYQHTGQRLPLDAAPLRFASWMGGDRDGNPNVTAAVTEKVLTLARWEATDLFLRDIHELREDLSIVECNQALRARVGDHPEPYRELLREVRQRLRNTRDWAEAQVRGSPFPVEDKPIYLRDEELREPLQLIHASLVECGMAEIANGSLVDILRRLACFGLNLLKLDIRQESTRHAEAIGEITAYLGIEPDKGSYLDWPEEDKQAFLIRELRSRRPLVPRGFPASSQVQEVLDTFAMLARQPAAALGAYVISMATHPSDVLAVRLLQKEAGCTSPQRIVPLFETLADLRGAADTIDRLLSLEWYREDIKGRQEVMIGYSDSAKDAGFFAASWAQYQTQEALRDVCDRHAVHLTLFHGRGGSASRGGGPAYGALVSQPPGTIRGSVRVTEQGEVIQFKFGLREIAMRSLELYAAGTLEATLAPPQPAPEVWRDMMCRLAENSVEEYRRIVRDDPRFVDYFRRVTPEVELQRLALGSRPARRKTSGGVASLRAIPWVFAWTQMRLMLPAWLGTGKALADALDGSSGVRIKEMAQQWPFFRMLLDMLEMVLAKADSTVAQYYQQRLLDEEAVAELGVALQAGLPQAIAALEKISGDKLLAEMPLLRRSVDLRNPYLDPLHIVQVEVMRRLRNPERDPEQTQLEQALMVSIAGIAAGLRNTG